MLYVRFNSRIFKCVLGKIYFTIVSGWFLLIYAELISITTLCKQWHDKNNGVTFVVIFFNCFTSKHKIMMKVYLINVAELDKSRLFELHKNNLLWNLLIEIQIFTAKSIRERSRMYESRSMMRQRLAFSNNVIEWVTFVQNNKYHIAYDVWRLRILIIIHQKLTLATVNCKKNKGF